jgi:hypothetical protein
LAGWIGFLVLENQTYTQFQSIGEPLAAALMTIAIHWFVMGMFLTGESPHLSPRVQRTLPKTSASRAFLTWFFPGPATGYVFVLANMAAAALMALLAMIAWEAVYPVNTGPFRSIRLDRLALLAVLCLGYMSFYLGLGKLILAWFRRYSVAGSLTSVLVQVLLVLSGCGIPLVIHLMSDRRMSGYNLLHVGNPFWSIGDMLSNRMPLYETSVVSIVAAAGFVMFMLNMRSIREEMRLVRAARPARVVEEDAELNVLHAATSRVPRDPWDEDS